MFSTSMIASSTTSPSAIASPPSVRVLMPKPRPSSTRIAASRESGIAVSEMAAPQVGEEQHQDDRHQRAAQQERVVMFRIARSMNSEGRKIAGSRVRPAASMAGARRASAASTPAGDDLGVGAELAGHHHHEPRTPFTPPSPNRGAAPSTTRPRSPSLQRRAVVLPHHGGGQAAGLVTCPSACTVSALVGLSITPAPRSPVARAAASAASAIPTP